MPVSSTATMSQTRLVKSGYQIPKDRVTEEGLRVLLTELTIHPKRWISRGPVEPVILYKETRHYYVVPRWWGWWRYGAPEVSLTDVRQYPTFRERYIGPCRPNQAVMLRRCWRGFRTQGGGLLVAGCGAGKTNVALMLAMKAGLKTLFLAHDTDLLRQFRERAYQTTTVRSVGWMQGNTVDVDHPLVCGTLQSLVRERGEGREYPEAIFHDFGLVIIDEMHHVAAGTFRRIFQRVCPRYIFGMSAEDNRTDGLFNIIPYHVGPILHREPFPPDDRVCVKRIEYHWENPIPSLEIFGHPGKTDYTGIASRVVANPRRNRLLLALIIYYIDQGRDILVLSARRDHLIGLHGKLEAMEGYQGTSGLYMGSMKTEDKQASLAKQVVFGTEDKAKEGLDVPSLTVLIMCTSQSRVRQPIGRILRKRDPACPPIVVDMADQAPEALLGQQNKRLDYYQANQYQVHPIRVGEQPGTHHYRNLERIYRRLGERPPPPPPPPAEERGLALAEGWSDSEGE